MFRPRFAFGLIGPDCVFGGDIFQEPASVLVQCRILRVGPQRHVFDFGNFGVYLGHLIILARGRGEGRGEIERHEIIVYR